MGVKILGDIEVTGSYSLSASDIPNLAASKITSGTLGTARIPSLAASKITSGTFDAARIPDLSGTYLTGIADNSVGIAQLNVTDGSSGQVLTTNGSGTLSFTTVATGSSSFDGLTSKTSGTGDYSTTGDLQSGRNSGGVALTINDGYGNANITWNHRNGTPEQNGNAARIEVNTDATTGATMWFEIKSGMTSGTAASLTNVMQMTESGLSMESGKTISAGGGNSTNWNTAYGWGNHASAGYGDATQDYVSEQISNLSLGTASQSAATDFVSATSADTMSGRLTASGGIDGLTLANGGISGSNYNITGVNQLEINDPGEGIVFTSGSSGNMSLAIVDDANDNILRFNGTNAVFQVGTNTVWHTGDFSSTNVSNWNTAYGWGNHASAGYLTAHPNISAATSVNNSGRTYIQDITLDSNGHITAITSATETVVNTNTTYSAGSGLDLSGTTFSVETDLRDGITHVGVSTSNYITFDNTNNRIDFYAGGNHVARMESDGDLHIKGDVIAFSTIFA